MKFSIIVPVYKVEEHLFSCISSILALQYDDLEIILVDDGSPDNCPKICDDFAKKDNRIKVIHQKNGGLSNARNTGIKHATGDYIIFVDSDDSVDGNLSSILHSLSSKPIVDILIANYKRIFLDHFKIEGNNSLLKDNYLYEASDNIKTILLEHTNGLCPVWKNIVSRAFIIENNLFFKEGYIHEDLDWTLRVIMRLESFIYTNNWWYNYVSERPCSIMNTMGLKSINHICDISYDIVASQDFIKQSKSLQKSIKLALGLSIYSTFRYYNKLDSNKQKEALEKYKKVAMLLKYSKKIGHRAFYILSRITGIKMALKLLQALNIN
ncbi:MAG: glycosyltransferase [Clostridiales bacterium]|nr:glycosyltransferase [Clostridiales bacterium]